MDSNDTYWAPSIGTLDENPPTSATRGQQIRWWLFTVTIVVAMAVATVLPLIKP